jgi:hypothetical protein
MLCLSTVLMIVCACVQAAKDRVLGENAVTIQQLRSEISEKGRMLGEMDRLLREKDTTIAEKDRLLRENAAVIAEKDRLLRDKDTRVAEKDRLLRGKDTAIAEKDRLLREDAASIADKDRLLREKERQVSQVSVCWDWRILSRCTINISFHITNNANGSLVVVCCADGNSGTSRVDSGVVCCPVIVVCGVVVCVCRRQRSAHCNHRHVVMLPLYALLRVCLGW